MSTTTVRQNSLLLLSPTSPSPSSSLVTLLLVVVAQSLSSAEAYQICPGMGLRSTKTGAEIVIFEHTILGTGGLVLNRPTPLQLGSLPIPRFQAFGECALMLGCGLEEEMIDDDDDASSSSLEVEQEWGNTLALGEVAPWFWLHNLDDLEGSSALSGAAGPLYMGGDLEVAVRRLQNENIDPVGRFKFFRKYKCWKTGEVESELEKGIWVAQKQDPTKALQPMKLPSINLEG